MLGGGAAGRPAVVVPGGVRLSYGDLGREVTRAAAFLRSRGIHPGDRVATVFPNSAEGLVLFLAAAWAGTAAPLNPAYKADELRFYLEDTRARLVIVPAGAAEDVGAALPAGAPVLEAKLDARGRMRFSGEADRGAPAEPAPPAGDGIALILHTSGTTSRPKIVPLRHRNLTASIGNIVETYRLGPEDVSLVVMPLFHVHGLLASTLATIASGGTVVIPARFNPLGLWPLAAEVRPTWWSASPAPLQMILSRAREVRPPGLESLRFVRSCSSALAPAAMAEMEERYGVPVLEAYGMTEASHQMASNPLPPGSRRPGTVGRGTGVRIGTMDEGGHLLSAGERGEVVIRGPNVIDGYERNPAANSSSFLDGWFRTGDRGFLDAEGYLKLVGRIKELINRGGEKIGPAEIDEVLEAHPKVREAVAFGVPHPTWGEEVAAAVVLHEPVPVKELQAWARERLADFKVPKVIHVVDAIPRTPTGKVQRGHVAASLIEAG